MRLLYIDLAFAFSLKQTNIQLCNCRVTGYSCAMARLEEGRDGETYSSDLDGGIDVRKRCKSTQSVSVWVFVVVWILELLSMSYVSIP